MESGSPRKTALWIAFWIALLVAVVGFARWTRYETHDLGYGYFMIYDRLTGHVCYYNVREGMNVSVPIRCVDNPIP